MGADEQREHGGVPARHIPPGDGRVVLLVVAHADDVALFLGGTVATWAEAGWRVVVVRVTDDRWDSVGSTPEATIAANTAEFRRAAAILGVAEIVEFGYPTDVLGDVSEVALRERIIREVRRHRPYALVSFDPYSMFGEDNQDHVKVAAASDEAFWTSQFDLHHT
jgi:LmbE family N-acetylglucosaminyl deacetylase